MTKFQFYPAINYSGYRDGQSPITKNYPSKAEILEDLRILENKYYYLRIYDCSKHAYLVLETIREYNLNFKVMLGLSVHAEENHKTHPFFHKHSEETMSNNYLKNKNLVLEIIALANKYKDIIYAISIGNEIRSHWSNHMLPIQRMIEITKEIKAETGIPVTYCEEYQLWLDELEDLAQYVDFISLHTYPAWQGFNIDEALSVAIKNYMQVQNKYPNKYCIITETGWPTKSHGSKIKVDYATVTNQKRYINEITEWAKNQDTLVYLFEAFDEPWKGGNNPIEPEKNWGIYDVNRKLKTD